MILILSNAQNSQILNIMKNNLVNFILKDFRDLYILISKLENKITRHLIIAIKKEDNNNEFIYITETFFVR